ncbi:MAG: hypothetical protein J5994_03860 [Ruminococcus sp.]|nr:hypothetical protein [Ruminococcus sp.]
MKFVTGEKGYDERQIAARGRGFMLAYLTSMAVLAILTCLDELTEYITPYSIFVVTAWSSLTVFSVYAVTHSAYDRINDTATGKCVFGMFGACGLFVIVTSLLKKGDVSDDLWTHIFVGAAMVINSGVYFIYHALHRNDDDEED